MTSGVSFTGADLAGKELQFWGISWVDPQTLQIVAETAPNVLYRQALSFGDLTADATYLYMLPLFVTRVNGHHYSGTLPFVQARIDEFMAASKETSDAAPNSDPGVSLAAVAESDPDD